MTANCTSLNSPLWIHGINPDPSRSDGDPPENIIAPQAYDIAGGVAASGEVVQATTGAWSGEMPITFDIQWYLGDTPIAGATGESYTVMPGDVASGELLYFIVTAANANGSADASSGMVTLIEPD